MKVDLDELERIAHGAEQSEWRCGRDPYSDQVSDVNNRRVCEAVWPGNAAHIAANSPPVVLALIARNRELRTALDEALTTWNRHDEFDSQKPDRDRLEAVLEKGAVLR